MRHHKLKQLLFREPNIGSFYWCKCSICNSPPRFIGEDNSRTIKIEDRLLEIEKVDKSIKRTTFVELLELLVGSNVLIPETVVFSEGLPWILVKFDDKENVLLALKVFQLPSIMSVILNEVKRRKKSLSEYRTKITMAAIVKYNDITQREETLTETEFIKLMMLRAGNEKWGTIHSIQGYIAGGTEKKTYKFLASLNPLNTLVIPKRKFRGKSTSEELADEKLHSICKKIGEYLKQRHCLELIYMKATFMRDEHGKIWLSDAEDIRTRVCEEKIQQKKERAEMERRSDLTKREVFLELDKLAADQKHVRSIDNYCIILDKNYNKVKKSTGLIPAEEIPWGRTFVNLPDSKPEKISVWRIKKNRKSLEGTGELYRKKPNIHKAINRTNAKSIAFSPFRSGSIARSLVIKELFRTENISSRLRKTFA